MYIIFFVKLWSFQFQDTPILLDANNKHYLNEQTLSLKRIIWRWGINRITKRNGLWPSNKFTVDTTQWWFLQRANFKNLSSMSWYHSNIFFNIIMSTNTTVYAKNYNLLSNITYLLDIYILNQISLFLKVCCNWKHNAFLYHLSG